MFSRLSRNHRQPRDSRRPVHIDKSLVKKIRGLIRKKDENALSAFLDELLPADIADVIEHLEPNERFFTFNALSAEQAAKILVEIEPPVRKLILEGLENSLVSKALQYIHADDAVDIIGNLPDTRAGDILGMLDPSFSRKLEKLLQYGKDTAGGIMDLDVVSVPQSGLVQDAVQAIGEKKDTIKYLYHVFVVDSSGRLTGVISLKTLLLETPGRKINDIMNPDVMSVNVHEDQEEVALKFKKYDLVNMPVVDGNHRLAGRITHDDIIDVIEEEVDEDLSLMTGAIGQKITEESPFKISRARLPWLITGVFGGIVAAFVIHRFETTLEKVIALSFFFPVIMGIGGNTGTQAATIIVRGIATGGISLVNIKKRLWLEMKVALINGISCGILLGLIVGFWLSDYALGAIVALAGVLIILNSGFTGSAVPFILKKMDIDPALATGPFITTLNDILGLFIYLGLLTLFLQMSS